MSNVYPGLISMDEILESEILKHYERKFSKVMMVYNDTGILWGSLIQIGDLKPIRGLPEGSRVKLKLRNNDWARCYVRLAGQTTVHHVKIDPYGGWSLDFPAGINKTLQ